MMMKTAKKIKKIDLIITFNNNKKLKVNLKDILIIKSYEEIAGLLYKIINKEKENIKKEKLEEESSLHEEESDEDSYIIEYSDSNAHESEYNQ